MPLENMCKLEKNFMQLSETQNNKQINYDPDYSLNSTLPLIFLLIHWHQNMLQCRGRNRDNSWWWNQIMLRSCQSRCNPFLLSVHVWVHCCQRCSFLTKAHKEHTPSHHLGHLGITRLLGSLLLTPESCLCPTLWTELLSKDAFFASLLIFCMYTFQLYFSSFYHSYYISCFILIVFTVLKVLMLFSFLLLKWERLEDICLFVHLEKVHHHLDHLGTSDLSWVLYSKVYTVNKDK